MVAKLYNLDSPLRQLDYFIVVLRFLIRSRASVYTRQFRKVRKPTLYFRLCSPIPRYCPSL